MIPGKWFEGYDLKHERKRALAYAKDPKRLFNVWEVEFRNPRRKVYYAGEELPKKIQATIDSGRIYGKLIFWNSVA